MKDTEEVKYIRNIKTIEQAHEFNQRCPRCSIYVRCDFYLCPLCGASDLYSCEQDKPEYHYPGN